MTQLRPVVEHILHPTDFSMGSEIAFVHALRIALATGASLDVVHVDPKPRASDWKDFPSVRETLIRWGVLKEGAKRSDVARTGINVHKSKAHADAPVKGIMAHIERHPADLIVLATHQRKGFDRWMHHHIASDVSRVAETATLFVPYGTKGFVRSEDGSLNLNRILLPAATSPHPDPAVATVTWIAEKLKCPSAEFNLLHVGEESNCPATSLPVARDGWTLEWKTRSGPIATEILAESIESKANLIAMTTLGRHGFLDAVRGSTTEQVLAGAECPVLAVNKRPR